MSDYFWAQSGQPIDPRWFDNGAPVSAGTAIGTAAEQAFQTSPTAAFNRWRRQADMTRQAYEDEASQGQTEDIARYLREQGEDIPGERTTRVLPPEEANRLYGIPNHLTFTRPISEAAAIDMRDARRADMVRRDALARADGGVFGWTARMGASFLGAAIDPINIASAFVPVIGPEMWAARLAASSTRLGRAGAAAGMGAVEGMVGQAMIEPLNQWFAAREGRDEDFGMAAALQNIAFGAVLGGVLHGGGRLIVDGWRGLPRMDPGVEREIHDAALRGAIAQIETGRVVDVEPVFQVARSLSRQELMGSASPLAMRGAGEAPGPSMAFAAPDRPGAPDAPPARPGEPPAPIPMGRDSNPMTRQEFADHTRAEDVRYAAEEAATIREGLAAGRYPETVDDLRAGQAHMTRAEAEARVAEMEARIAAPEIPPREVMDAAYDRYVHNVRDQRAAAEAPRPTPDHTRAMIERAASDAVRSANPEAWAAAQAARSQDIGGARPRTETPVGRVAAEIAEMDARIAEADAVLRQAAQQGRITEAELRALDVSDMEARAQERGRGLEAGAACLIMNGARP